MTIGVVAVASLATRVTVGPAVTITSCVVINADFENLSDEVRRSYSLHKEILAPYPSALMTAHDVSPLVNKSEKDQADCISPVADRQFRLV